MQIYSTNFRDALLMAKVAIVPSPEPLRANVAQGSWVQIGSAGFWRYA